MTIGLKEESPIEKEFSPFHMLKWVVNLKMNKTNFKKKKTMHFKRNASNNCPYLSIFFWQSKVLTDIGSDSSPAVPSKPVGAPAAHSLITSPNYQLSPRSNYSTDVTTSTNIISNGNHSPVVRETTKTLQKTEVLHVDTNSEPVP